MRNIRIIAKLDIKAPNLVKTIQLEGLRKIGIPNEFALKYYQEGIDEIFYQDVVASLYDRNSLYQLVEETISNIFIPVTVGGGLRTLKDVESALKFGADKVSINTAAILRPNFIKEISREFGSQCLVINIQSKKIYNNDEPFYYSGRERSFLQTLDWSKKCQDLGAGEIMLTSIDNEGTQKGFDIDLIEKVMKVIEIPIIASGGMGETNHIESLYGRTSPDAICVSHVLHYNKYNIKDLRKTFDELKLPIRHL